MKYYTLILLDNEQVQTIRDKPRQFTECVVNALNGTYFKMNVKSFNLNNTPIGQVLRPKNVLEESLYVFKQGEVTELNPHLSQTKELQELEPEKFNSNFEVVKNTYEGLKSDEAQLIHSAQEPKGEFIEPTEINTSGLIAQPTVDPEKVVAQWLIDNGVNLTVEDLKNHKNENIVPVKEPLKRTAKPINKGTNKKTQTSRKK